MAAADVISIVDRAMRDHFGEIAQRASVSFVGVEPIEVLRFEPIPGERAYISLGMARHPMTAADAMLREEHGPRAELMLHIRGLDPPDAWRQLAVLAAAPAVEGVAYSPGMTVDLGSPIGAGARCSAGVIVASTIAPIATPDGLVDVLQVLPATSTEIAWTRVHGTAAILDRWRAQETDLMDLARPAADLS